MEYREGRPDVKKEIPARGEVVRTMAGTGSTGRKWR